MILMVGLNQIDLQVSKRRTLAGDPDPPVGEWVQPNIILPVELVKTSQVTDAPFETLNTGQASVTVTAAAIAATEIPGCLWVMLQADHDNTDDIRIGPSSAQYWRLPPGIGVVIPIDDHRKIVADADSGTQLLNWFVGVL